jgi:HAE1 family hydrophobic/amphiphilic exporter-1
MIVSLKSTSKAFDQIFLMNYAKINMVDDLSRVSGVGQVSIFGNRDYSMRIWLNPQKMAGYGVSPQQVTAAIQSQNLEAAPGSLGENSSESMQYIIKYKGKNKYPGDYEQMVIRANADGSLLRLGDIARVEFGAYSYAMDSKANGLPACCFAVYQAPGSNANEVEIGVRKALLKQAESFPEGLSYTIPSSTKKIVDESIEQVLHTLLEAFILVFIVVFLFLQDVRSTLIPAIAVPVAIVATFFFINVLGFSINVLTLFGMVLAIGIVVDDAIVVGERVHVLEQEGMGREEAAIEGTYEVSVPVIFGVLTTVAAFLPLLLLEGPLGGFFSVIGGVVILCLTASVIESQLILPGHLAHRRTTAHPLERLKIIKTNLQRHVFFLKRVKLLWD